MYPRLSIFFLSFCLMASISYGDTKIKKEPPTAVKKLESLMSDLRKNYDKAKFVNIKKKVKNFNYDQVNYADDTNDIFEVEFGAAGCTASGKDVKTYYTNGTVHLNDSYQQEFFYVGDFKTDDSWLKKGTGKSMILKKFGEPYKSSKNFVVYGLNDIWPMKKKFNGIIDSGIFYFKDDKLIGIWIKGEKNYC